MYAFLAEDLRLWIFLVVSSLATNMGVVILWSGGAFIFLSYVPQHLHNPQTPLPCYHHSLCFPPLSAFGSSVHPSPPLLLYLSTISYRQKVTPLHEAAGSSSPEVIRLLLDAGADISSSSGDLSTAFHIACSRGRPETCVELLRRGSLLEARDAQGMTPLLRAAANGRAEVTRWLLEEGADPAAVDIYHNTALALSCRATGRLDAARALLDAGADVLEENADGSSCVSLAAISGRTELLDMMLAAMACSGQRFRDGGGNVLYDAVDHGLGKVRKEHWFNTSSRMRIRLKIYLVLHCNPNNHNGACLVFFLFEQSNHPSHKPSTRPAKSCCPTTWPDPT